jgi:hypothetical protein
MLSDKKTCFVIAPIGAQGTDVRTRSDQILKYLIEPAAQECGYDAIRADRISEPGLITSQVIQHIVEDPLVIADLTGHNPNVFYELALRHALKKAVVQIIHATEPIPFDVAASRTIQVDHHNLDSVAWAKEEIVRQIRAAEANPTEVDTPISVGIELQLLRQSDNPLEKSNAEIITMLQDIRNTIKTLNEGQDILVHPSVPYPVVNNLLHLIEITKEALFILEDKSLEKEKIDKIRHVISQGELAVEYLTRESYLTYERMSIRRPSLWDAIPIPFKPPL